MAASNAEETTSEQALGPGEMVSDLWRVVSKVGEGGFGAVYKVANVVTEKEYAMKLEPIKEKVSMIKLEVAVLKTFRKQEALQRHACHYFESGKTLSFRYVVMELLGPNLSDLRRARPNGRFSEDTTVRVGMQQLESIACLHRIGFLHRDIKPANYAMGPGVNCRIVYMLDYGLARRYLTRSGKLREERKSAAFRGTVRYASITAHTKKDLGRRDDLWSLLYVLIEFRRGELPWRKIPDRNEVGKRKKEIEVDQLLQGMPPEFYHIHCKLQSLEFGDRPDYAWFREQLQSVLIRKAYQENGPFDWELSDS